jgi:DNA-binding GntR family transcriptional regulator
MSQMCELRDYLEPKVMEWAACRRTDEGLLLLKEQLQRLRAAAASGSFTRFFAEDLEFHRRMWELAGNPSATRALMTVVGCLFACGLRNASVDLPQQYLKHERLYQAIAECRPSDASVLLTDISAGFRSQLYRVAQEQGQK